MNTGVLYRPAARALHRSRTRWQLASIRSSPETRASFVGWRAHSSRPGHLSPGGSPPIVVLGGFDLSIARARSCGGRALKGAASRRHASGSAGSEIKADAAAVATAARERAHRETRRRVYERYREKNTLGIGLFSFFQRFNKGKGGSRAGAGGGSVHDRNVKLASYAAAAVIGALGATYASVPLYKMFCQATGFGGTTQRVTLGEWAEKRDEREEAGSSGRTGKISQALWDKLTSASNIPLEMLPKRGQSHGQGGPKTWTDEDAAARLASLKPVKDGRLITVRFDSTVGDVMPWSFTPTQLDVKIVPGETALSFFTATNHSKDRAITGVATYNVHPPRAGLYFNKIQCFCFEEQRLLPGETVDMPVFFFVDPEYADDPQLARCNNITLSYTFFQTDEDDDDDDDEDEEEGNEEDAVNGKGERSQSDQMNAGTHKGWLRGWLSRS